MGLKVEKKVLFNIRNLEFGYINGDGNWVSLTPDSEDHAQSVKKSDIVLAINQTFEMLVEYLIADLTELYNMIE